MLSTIIRAPWTRIHGLLMTLPTNGYKTALLVVGSQIGNLIVLLFALWQFSVSMEHRLTRLETLVTDTRAIPNAPH